MASDDDATLADPAHPLTGLSSAQVHRRLDVDLPAEPGAVLDALRAATAHTTEPFSMVSKLSGGGIVVRVLRTPETERAFFGRVTTDGFVVAPVHRGGDVTPFQPLIRGTVVPSDGGGTRLHLHLHPHPHAQAYDIVFTVVGVLMLVGAGLLATQSVASAGMLAFFGLLGVVFPKLRARAGFAAETRRALTGLAEVLDAPALREQAEAS